MSDLSSSSSELSINDNEERNAESNSEFIQNNQGSSDDQFKILLATDIHLGFKEDDPIRGEDTYRAFEEILELGASNQVDFVLLGGDLFHDTKPSPYCINKCIRLLRKYCLGDKPVSVEILSDQKINFDHTLNKMVNYEDPNLNVGMPVFSIHGNHDDPTGKNQVSAMDLMASTGLVNYFGRWEDLTQVEINPILLKKGTSLLALYGLSHIADQRLGRLFLEEKVSIAKPDNLDGEEFFNLLVVHQNRAPRGAKNFIPTDAIPKDIDLVMWGHEHDCRITPEKVGDIYITQPGSSVATSLAAGEALPKKVGILRIQKMKFKIEEIELQTVRPFIFEDLILDFHNVPVEEQLEKSKRKITNCVETMIEKAAELKRIPAGILPLIRLRAHYKHEQQIFNAIKFSQQYVGRVANPEDILKFINVSSKKRDKQIFDKDLDYVALDNQPARRVEDIILQYLEDSKNKLNILSAKGVTEAIVKFINTDDNEAPEMIVNYQFEKTLNKLKELNPEEDEIDDCLENLRNLRTAQTEVEEINNVLNNPNRRRAVKSETGDDDDVVTVDDSDDDRDTGVGSSRVNTTTTTTPRPLKGPGSRGGRGSRGGSRGRGRRGQVAV